MIIEQTDMEDAKEILVLQKLCYISEAEIYSDYTISPLVQTIDEIKAQFKDYFFLKAVESGRIIGSVRARMSNRDTCYIGRLIVHPNFQNQGIGTQLMEMIEEIFDKCQRWELMTGDKSEKNIIFYEKRGYHKFRAEKLNSNLNLIFFEKFNKIK